MGRGRLSVLRTPRASPFRFRGTRVAGSFSIRKASAWPAPADSVAGYQLDDSADGRQRGEPDGNPGRRPRFSVRRCRNSSRCFLPMADGSPTRRSRQGRGRSSCGPFRVQATGGRSRPRAAALLSGRAHERSSCSAAPTALSWRQPTPRAARLSGPRNRASGWQGAAAKGVISSFDLHPDGQRFAAPPMQTAEDRPDTLAFVFNFFEEVKRLAAASARP